MEKVFFDRVIIDKIDNLNNELHELVTTIKAQNNTFIVVYDEADNVMCININNIVSFSATPACSTYASEIILTNRTCVHCKNDVHNIATQICEMSPIMTKNK